jgi:mannose-6-phosphate isomerase-like protein (cupin superfamily)
MKYLLALLTLVSATVLIHAQAAQPPRGRGRAPARPKPLTEAVFIDHDKVAAAFMKGGNLVVAPDMTVLGSHRAVAGRVEVHDKETDVMYVIDGSANFITGGAMVGGKVSRPGQWFGTGITGGEMHHLTKGDMIIVPAGMPHWFKETTPQISYYVVKVIKP